MSIKRISKELSDLIREPLQNCSAQPIDSSNLLRWKVHLKVHPILHMKMVYSI